MLSAIRGRRQRPPSAGRAGWRAGRWPARKAGVAALLVALLGAYLLAARQLFWVDGEPLTAVPGVDPSETGTAGESADLTPAVATAPLVAADGGTALARGDPGRTGAVAAVGPSRLPVLLWSLQVGEVLAEPVVADGVVYAGSEDGIVYALEAATGAIRWRFATTGAITGSPVVAARTVYVVGANTLYAIDAATGNARWNRPLFGSGGEPAALPGASPLVAGGTVYVAEGTAALADGRLVVAGTTATTVFAVATETGEVRWSSDLTAQGLHALAATDGRPLWQVLLASPPGRPAVSDGVVYFVDFGADEVGRLAAVDAASGDALWTDPIDRRRPSMPAVVGDTVLLVSEVEAGDAPTATVSGSDGESTDRQKDAAIGAVTALVTSAEGATTFWQVAGLSTAPGRDGNATSPVTIAGRLAYAGTADGALLAIDLTTGRQRWRYEAGAAGLHTPAIAEGVVFVTSADGRLLALRAEATTTTETSPVAAMASATAPPAASRFLAGQIVYVVVDEARLRSFPTETGTEVTRLGRGTSLQIADAVLTGNEQFGYWWQVRVPSSPGLAGYVRDEQIADGVTAGQPTPTAVPIPVFADGQTVAIAADGIAIWPSPYPTGARAVAWLMRGDAVVLDGGAAIVATGERWVRVHLASDATVVGYVQEAYLGETAELLDVAAPGIQPGEIVLVVDVAAKLYRTAGDETDWIEVLSLQDGWVVTGPSVKVGGVVWWPIANPSGVGSGWVKETEVVGAGMAPEGRVGLVPATPSVAGTPSDAASGADRSSGTPIATATPTATSGRFRAGDVVRVTEDDVQVHPEPTTRNAPITILPSRTQLLITGPARAVEGVVWWPVDDPMTGRSGYVMDGFVEPHDRPAPTPVAETGGFAAGDPIVVNADGIAYRPSPRHDQDPIRMVLNGEVLIVTGEPVEADGSIWLPAEDAFGVDGYVPAESATLLAGSGPTPVSTLIAASASDPASAGDPPDLRSIELTMAIEAPELAAGEAEALADLDAELELNLRFLRRNGCRPELVVLAVGAAAAPEEAVAAAAAIEGVLRHVYDPVFRSVDILRFADAGTLAGRVRIRVFYYEC